MRDPRGPRDAALHKQYTTGSGWTTVKQKGGEQRGASVRKVLLQGSDSSSNFAVDAASHFHHAPVTRRGRERGAIARRSENGLTDVIIGVASQCNGVMFRITDARVLATLHGQQPHRSLPPAARVCPPHVFLAAPIHPHGSGRPRRGWRMTCRQRRDRKLCAQHTRTAAEWLYAAHDTAHAMEAQHAALIDATFGGRLGRGTMGVRGEGGCAGSFCLRHV